MPISASDEGLLARLAAPLGIDGVLECCFINGEFVPAADTLEILNPATGKPLGRGAACSGFRSRS